MLTGAAFETSKQGHLLISLHLRDFGTDSANIWLATDREEMSS